MADHPPPDRTGSDEPPQKKAKTTTGEEEKIPRPRNPFIIFRSAHAASVREQMRGSTQADISKYISALWAACSPTEKAHYERMAALEKEEHERKYPDYKFRPKSKAEKARRAAELKKERELKKALQKKAKAAAKAAAVLPPIPYASSNQLPYHVAAQFAGFGPSPPYYAGSLPSTSSSPSNEGSEHEPVDNAIASTSSASPMTPHVFGGNAPYVFTFDGETASPRAHPDGSESTSRVPSSSTVVHHPTPEASSDDATAISEPEQTYNDDVEAAGHAQAPLALDATVDGNHVPDDTATNPMSFGGEDFNYDDFLNPVPFGELTDSADVPLPPLFWDNEGGNWAGFALDNSTYRIPGLDVTDLHSSNMLSISTFDMPAPPQEVEQQGDLLGLLHGHIPAQHQQQFQQQHQPQFQQPLQQPLQQPPQQPPQQPIQQLPQQPSQQPQEHQFFDVAQLIQEVASQGISDMNSYSLQGAAMYYSQQYNEQPQAGPSSQNFSRHPSTQFDSVPPHYRDAEPVASSSQHVNYTPPSGALRAGTRRVAGSWRPTV